jgi:hypothetical protein
MTGQEHYAEAERLLAVADRHTSGVTYGPEWTLTLTAAHVHATLALAAATAVGTAGPDLNSILLPGYDISRDIHAAARNRYAWLEWD